MTPHEKDILKSLAGQVRVYADLPAMTERRERWYKHNACEHVGPMVLCYPECSWAELVPETTLECNDDFARAVERELRRRIYWWEHIRDDNTLEPYFVLPYVIHHDGYGVDIVEHHGENRGSYVWDAPLKNVGDYKEKLHFRQPVVDREETQRQADQLNDCFGDILPIRFGDKHWWTLGLTWEAIKLIGLEKLMMAMYDTPDDLHGLMQWLSDEALHFINWCETEGILGMNNENGYTGSGGVAYTHELPQDDWKEGMPVRLKDIWGFAESQETAGVSPQMFGEFIFPYQLPLLEKFGLNCYGCCEPVHTRWDMIKTIPRLRRVSVSPWCDMEIMANELQQNYIYSRKPNPAPLCVSFDEKALRKELENVRDIAGECILEVIMKDTHTVENDPARITKWVQMAREILQG